jgi:hypothetical protein
MSELVVIQINGRSYEIPKPVFRRMLSCTVKSLSQLKAAEGNTFPGVDKETLDIALKFKLEHNELI